MDIGLKTKTRKSRWISIVGSAEFKCIMNLFFDYSFNFLSAKTKMDKKLLNLVNLDGLALKRQKNDTWIAMCLNHLDSISTVFGAIFPYYSIVTFLLSFRDFWVFSFGYRSQKENPEITENLYFSFFKVEMHMNLFFNHYFNILSVRTKIDKNFLNLVNLYGLAFKRQEYDT